MIRGLALALVVLAAGVVFLSSSPRVRAGETAGVAAPASALSPAAAQAVGRRAMALVAEPDGLGFALTFAPGGAELPRARTDTDARTITVFVRRGDAVHRIAHDIAHEYGHAWDHVHMSAADRAAYLRSRGVPAASWWPEGPSDYASGAGDFAEVFAACRAASPEFRSRLAPAPPDFCAALPPGAGGPR